MWDKSPTSFFYKYVSSSPIYWREFSLPHWMSWHPPQKSIGRKCIALFLECKIYSIIYIFTLMPVSHCFDYYSFVLKFEIRKCESFSFVHFINTVLTIWHSLHFMWVLRSAFLFLKKKVIGILNGISLIV